MPRVSIRPHKLREGMPSLVDLLTAQVLLPLGRVSVLVPEFLCFSHCVRHIPSAVQLALLFCDPLDLLPSLRVLVHIDFPVYARETLHLLFVAYWTYGATWGEV